MSITNTLPHHPSFRQFTREEDELIVQNSLGLIKLSSLRSRFRADTRTIERRARELGVKIRKIQTAIRVQRKEPVVKKPPAPIVVRVVDDERMENSCDVGHNDELLAALHLHHNDRRYEELIFGAKKRKRRS